MINWALFLDDIRILKKDIDSQALKYAKQLENAVYKINEKGQL